VGVNVNRSWLLEASNVFNCKVYTLPIVYMGLPVGGNPRRLNFWEPAVDRIKSRLSSWNNIYLYFGGRLVLLKSVLTLLYVYALCFFKAPSGIIASIDSLLLRVFFLGGSEENRKISWID
jgi:hypothetical protein